MSQPSKPKIIQKSYFDVKIETMLPATLTYRVYAEDATKAAEMIRHMQPSGVKYRLHGKRNIKLYVYDAGSSMIRLIKNMVGLP